MIIGLSTFSTLLTLSILLIVTLVYVKNIRFEIMGSTNHVSKTGSSDADYRQDKRAS